MVVVHMRRTLVVASIALGACVSSIVRAPNQIPADGNVECTDTMEVPIAATVIAVASAGLVAYALSHPDRAINTGGLMWVPTATFIGVDSLFSAGLGYSRVRECRDAKRRGAELAELTRNKAEHRAEAGALWKRAAAAARADDCATVRELDPQIRELDVEFHAVVFARDVGIARCLANLR